MNIEQWTVIVPIALSVLASLGSGIAWWSQRTKRSADAASTLTASAMTMVNELQEQLSEVRANHDAVYQMLQAEQEINRDMDRSITDLNTAVDRQKNALDMAVLALDEERLKRRDLERRVNDLESENRQLQAENRQLKQQLETLDE